MGKNQQKDWASRPTAHDSCFTKFKRILHEGLPRKQRKMRLQEKRETTSCRMVNAGILWTKATCSAPWSVITSAPAECVGFFFFLFLPGARARPAKGLWKSLPKPARKVPACLVARPRNGPAVTSLSLSRRSIKNKAGALVPRSRRCLKKYTQPIRSQN